jgi:hypothetical protein
VEITWAVIMFDLTVRWDTRDRNPDLDYLDRSVTSRPRPNEILRQRHVRLPSLPRKADRLVTEIRRTLDSEDDISIDGKLDQCEYL